MLVARKSKKFNVSPTQNLEFDWKASLPVVDLHPRMLLSRKKFIFCGWLTLMQSHLFSKLAGLNYHNYQICTGPVKRKVNCSELSVEKDCHT